ncbi:NAD(P)-binding protein [Whalleya microplaca]|nr:NAD(P)-binding protein [Whalleya microplaca]
MSLRGKRCIVTGSSRGIGLAIAQLFAVRGGTCVLAGRTQRSLDFALQTLSTEGDQNHRTFPLDVTSGTNWDHLVHEMEDENCDILVNCAGISQNSVLARTPDDKVNAIVDTNLMGTIWGCKKFIPKMMRQRKGGKEERGCIVNVSSLLATHGGRGASIYAASKAGVVAFTRSLAWETGRFGIRVNALLPGYVQTRMTEQLDNEGKLSTTVPLGRLGTTDEIASAALFLVVNSYVHNCVLNIDGGLSAT